MEGKNYSKIYRKKKIQEYIFSHILTHTGIYTHWNIYGRRREKTPGPL